MDLLDNDSEGSAAGLAWCSFTGAVMCEQHVRHCSHFSSAFDTILAPTTPELLFFSLFFLTRVMSNITRVC